MRIAQLLNCSIAKLLNRSNNETMKQSNNRNNYQGFTLLELLVSISIIGVLISLASVSYSSAQKKSRDAKRQGDLKAVQNAMEQYYSICGYVYPASLPAVGNPIFCVSPSIAVMDKVPADPKSGLTYTCSSCTTSSYTLCANDAEVIPTPCVKNLQ